MGGGQYQFKHDCPKQHRDDDFVAKRWSVVASESKFPIDPQHHRNPERDAYQIIEIRPQQRHAHTMALDKPVHPVGGKAREE